MQLHSIACGNFKLDGGAMFGVVPKPIWERTNPADSNNRIEMCSRSLLIEDGNRLILIDTGMGNKQSEKFFSTVITITFESFLMNDINRSNIFRIF